LLKYDTINLLIRSDAVELVSLYCKGKNVRVIPISKEKISNIGWIETNIVNTFCSFGDSQDILFHGCYDSMRSDSFKNIFSKNSSQNFAKEFYTLYNIDYTTKVDKFYFSRNLKIENIFFQKFNPKTNYKLYHKEYELQSKDDFISLNKISNNFFESIKLLENSKELHLVDSSWAAFSYLIDSKYEILKNKGIKVFVYPFLGYRGGTFTNNGKSLSEKIEPIELENWNIMENKK
jgi:hypothetical protein